MSLSEVAKNGSRLETLIAIRDRLAEDIDGATNARDVAALTKQLADIVREIDEMPEAAAATPADEIAERRKQRLAQE